MTRARHLTVAQVARATRCTRHAVRAWIRSELLTATPAGDGYRIRLDALAKVVSWAGDRASSGNRGTNQGQPRNSPEQVPRYVDLELLEDLMTADHLSLAEAADYMKRSTRTVRRWVEEGRLPNAKRVVQRLLIPREDLDALVQPARRAAVGA